jgi:hypothetical protein
MMVPHRADRGLFVAVVRGDAEVVEHAGAAVLQRARGRLRLADGGTQEAAPDLAQARLHLR